MLCTVSNYIYIYIYIYGRFYFVSAVIIWCRCPPRKGFIYGMAVYLLDACIPAGYRICCESGISNLWVYWCYLWVPEFLGIWSVYAGWNYWCYLWDFLVLPLGTGTPGNQVYLCRLGLLVLPLPLGTGIPGNLVCRLGLLVLPLGLPGATSGYRNSWESGIVPYKQSKNPSRCLGNSTFSFMI